MISHVRVDHLIDDAAVRRCGKGTLDLHSSGMVQLLIVGIKQGNMPIQATFRNVDIHPGPVLKDFAQIVQNYFL